MKTHEYTSNCDRCGAEVFVTVPIYRDKPLMPCPSALCQACALKVTHKPDQPGEKK